MLGEGGGEDDAWLGVGNVKHMPSTNPSNPTAVSAAILIFLMQLIMCSPQVSFLLNLG